MSTVCPTMVAFTVDGVAKLVYCGKWACKICAKKNARKWSIIAYFACAAHMENNGVIYFWTFTMGSKYKRPAEAYKDFPRLWDNVRKAIQRHYKRFDFVAFVEGQPERSFMPHFHVITFQAMPKGNSTRKDPRKWIKDFAVRMGFGHQAFDEIVNSLQAAAYVTKYASKGCPEIPKNFRRCRSSRKWLRPPDKEHDAYIVRSVGEPIEEYLLRVEEASGVSIDKLVKDYQHADVNMRYERERNI